MICSKCKQELPNDSEFCHFCGTKVSREVYPTSIPKTPRRKAPIIIGIISVVAVVLIAVFIVLMIGNNNKEDTYNVGVRTITFSDRSAAENALAFWEDGNKTEQSMISIMDQYGPEQGGGQLYVITPGEFVEEIEEWCFSDKRKQGDYAIIENPYGFSLCYFSGRNIEDDSVSQDNYSSESSVMIVAIEADFAPYSWSEGGEYYGLHVDLAKEIAKRTDKSVLFEIVDFEDLISGVDTGIYDLAFGLERTSEREELVSFTDEYYDGMCAIYHTKDSEPSFSEWIEYTKTLQDIKEDGTLKTLLSKYNLS